MTTLVQMYSELMRHSDAFKRAGISVTEIITPKMEPDFFGDFGKFMVILADETRNETYYIEEIDGKCVLGIRGENMVLTIEDHRDVAVFIRHNRCRITRFTKYIKKVMEWMCSIQIFEEC